jgi:hypothetical protein
MSDAADTPPDNVVAFPRMLRVEWLVERAPPRMDAVVDHDGRPYALGPLLARLRPEMLAEIASLAPGNAQQAWDAAVRRFPREAEAAALHCGKAG